MKTFSAKQKWIYASSAVALFSMFLPWFVWGARSDNGWETDYYFLLACWLIPLISANNNVDWKVINIISLLIGSLAFVAFFGENASVTLLGNTYSSHVGAGAYVYLLAWLAAFYSELMVPSESFDANDISGNAKSASANEELFLQVTRDFENNIIDEALWIKAITICDGDKDKAKFRYIRDQVSRLEQELIKNNRVKKTTLRNTIEELKMKLLALDKDVTLKKSLYSMVLGVLSILGLFGAVSFISFGLRSIMIMILGSLTASVGGLVLGLADIKNKHGVSKKMSISGITMSILSLAIIFAEFFAVVFYWNV